MDVLEYPRIAAQFAQNSGYGNDWALTFRRNASGGGDEIVVNARYNGLDYGQTANDHFFNNCTGYGSTRPVISYVGDVLFVVWNQTGTCTAVTNGTGTPDVLTRRLFWDAGFVDALDFLRVNLTTTGTQATPSVAGRWAQDNYTWYGWHDASTSRINFRRTYYNNNPLRPTRGGNTPAPAVGLAAGTDAGRLQLYPNPATPDARLVLNVPAGETPTTVQVVDLKTGQPVGTMTADALRTGEMALRTVVPAGLRPGFYALRLTTNAGVYTERFEYQP